MSKGQNIQDPFLNTLRKERVPVSVFLVNGIKLDSINQKNRYRNSLFS